MENTEKKFSGLLEIVARLRAPDGCPWDRKQTAETFKSYVIEEAHELLEAIDGGDPAHVCEELGDLLFQLVFLTRLYAEQGQFGMAEVIEAISAKMVRRHPHVFGDIEAGSDEELRRRWQDIKAQEKGRRDQNHLASLPRSLPALRRAQRVAERAPLDGKPLTRSESLRKLEQGFGRAVQAVMQHEQEAPQAMGRLLLAVVGVCRVVGINAEEALQAVTDQAISNHVAGETAVESPVKSAKND